MPIVSDNSSGNLLSTRHRRALLVSVLSAAGVYLAAVIYAGVDGILQALGAMGTGGWMLLLACSMTNYLFRYLRWHLYLQQAGYTLPHKTHFLYYLSGFALTTTPGKAGETMRSVLLRPHGVPYPVSLASFFSERFLDVVVIALLATLTVLAFPDHQYYVVSINVMILLLIPLVRLPGLANFCRNLSGRCHRTWLRRFFDAAAVFLDSTRGFLAWSRLIWGGGLGLAAWSVQGLAFYFILQTLNVSIDPFVAMGIYAISLLAGAVSFVPGGIGTTEVAMGLLLSAIGAEPIVVVAAPIISRLSTLWFAVVLGILASSWLGFSSNSGKIPGQRKIPDEHP